MLAAGALHASARPRRAWAAAPLRCQPSSNTKAQPAAVDVLDPDPPLVQARRPRAPAPGRARTSPSRWRAGRRARRSLARSAVVSGAPGAATRNRTPVSVAPTSIASVPRARDAAQRPHAQVQHRRRRAARDRRRAARSVSADGPATSDLSAIVGVAPQLLGHLGGRLAEQHARLARHELPGLEAIVVEHRAHVGLELLEHAPRVRDALVEVAPPRVVRGRRELGEVVDVRRQRGHLPRQIVQEVRQPVTALDDLGLLASAGSARPACTARACAAAPRGARGAPARPSTGANTASAPTARARSRKLPQIVERADDHRHEVRAHVVLEPGAEIDAARRRHAVVDEHDVGRVEQRLLERRRRRRRRSGR